MGVGLSPVRVCSYPVACSQLSPNFIPDIDRNLTFRGCSSIMELASSTIWYVHTDVLVDIYLLIVA